MITAKNILTSHTRNSPTLTTLEIEIPKFLVAELNTHRAFSRNSASSRAIPTKRIFEQVYNNPYIPRLVGTYNAGMQPRQVLPPDVLQDFQDDWVSLARDSVHNAAYLLYSRDDYRRFFAQATVDGLYSFDFMDELTPVAAKEHVNRLLEPFMMTKVVLSSTDWDNFLTLRSDPSAQYEMQDLAEAVRVALDNPEREQELGWDDWHLPYIDSPFGSIENILYSASACAKVSYLREGTAMDLERATELLASGHLSPFEHTAVPSGINKRNRGNFTGWSQARHILEVNDQGVVRVGW